MCLNTAIYVEIIVIVVVYEALQSILHDANDKRNPSITDLLILTATHYERVDPLFETGHMTATL